MTANLRRSGRRLALRNPFKLLSTALLAKMVARCQIFDWNWYCVAVGAKPDSAEIAALMFVQRGNGGNAANPLFDADWYRSQYGFRGTPAQALLHFRCIGERIGLQPSPWFHARHYRKLAGMSLRRGSSLETFNRRWRDIPGGHTLFDADFYLQAYPDVASSGQNPLVHFAVYGWAEGRLPNAFFSPGWYLKQYTDVAAAGGNPALHYFVHGAAEGRSPGPDFDAHRYATLFPEQRASGLDPLSHFLLIGRANGYANETPGVPVSELVQRQHPTLPASKTAGIVDIILPVYRGLEETRNCLESVLRSKSSTAIRLRIYNDCSPDSGVTQYLRAVAAREPAIFLVENEVNLGFVGTVNRGMRAALGVSDCAAVLLLNSDTVVAGDWVDRMFSHVAEGVASVTALSNNATICSYPQLGVNVMPPGLTAADVDAVARVANAGRSVEIPTGVGCCMLISRRSLERIGLFDEEAFGMGYGEENDFCMRAIAGGFRHLLALDVFVEHIGEVSFADVSKPGKAIAAKIIEQRYPHYSAMVSAWVTRDPARAARLRLTIELWKAGSRPVHALITHDLGGGTERHVQKLAEELALGGHVVIIRPVHGRPTRLRVESAAGFAEFSIEVEVGDGDGLAALLRAMGVSSIQVHHLLGHGEMIRAGLAIADIPFEFIVHDYFTLCPQVTLTTARGGYCGEPNAAGCDACIRERPSHGASDIRNWRIANEWVVRNADSVKAPSRDTASRIERNFGVKPQVRSHESSVESAARPMFKREAGTRRPICVVILGVLAPHKGRGLVLETVAAAQRKQLPLVFHLIGDPQGPIPASISSRLTWTGWYEQEDLPKLISQAGPDLFLFASQAPETHSFTLTSAKATGLPIVATELGAFPERLEDYGAARMVRPDIPGAELADSLVSWFTVRKSPEVAHE